MFPLRVAVVMVSLPVIETLPKTRGQFLDNPERLIVLNQVFTQPLAAWESLFPPP